MLIRPQRKHGPKAEMIVVPYIDVMLVLLVIFMVTAPMLTQGVKIELPKVAAEALATDTRQQTDSAVTLEEMSAKVMQVVAARSDTQVYIRADDNAGYGRVVAAMAVLQKGGVSNLGLVTEAPQ